jgi:hypothetical protein
VPTAFISMIICLWIWKMNLGLKNKDFFFTKIEDISFYTFVISLWLGFILSFM